jgi:hypothetical protein
VNEEIEKLVDEISDRIKQHSDPLVHGLVDILTEQIRLDRERRRAMVTELAQIEGLLDQALGAVR